MLARIALERTGADLEALYQSLRITRTGTP